MNCLHKSVEDLLREEEAWEETLKIFEKSLLKGDKLLESNYSKHKREMIRSQSIQRSRKSDSRRLVPKLNMKRLKNLKYKNY